MPVSMAHEFAEDDEVKEAMDGFLKSEKQSEVKK